MELIMCPHTAWEAPQDEGKREGGVGRDLRLYLCWPRPYQGCFWLSIIPLCFIYSERFSLPEMCHPFFFF